MSTTVEPPIVVAALCLRGLDGRILTVRKRGTTSFMQPGGKIEPGETPAEAAVREAREELGAEIDDLRLLGEWRAAAANEPGREIESTVFTARLLSMTGPAAEIEEVRWLDPAAPDVPLDRLAPLLRDHVLPVLPPLPPVTVVGIGADGWAGLASASRDRVLAAEVLLGGERHLALVPEVAGQVRRPWPRPLSGLGDLLREHEGRTVVALASGDPFVSGIGTTLAGLVGDRLEVVPTLSSVTLARARLHWPAETTPVVTLVGRDPDALRRELAPGRRLLVLSADETTPLAVARLLCDEGFGGSRMVVLGDLGGASESRTEGLAAVADDWARDLPRLHVLALDLVGPAGNSWASGLADDRFEHDGQLTKRDLRAVALARLAPHPGALLWDVGAGAGSVGIEWLRAHAGCEAVAIEAHPDRVARIARNAAALGVPRLRVVEGRAPHTLAGLPDPDAVFVGGGATVDGVLAICEQRLRPGGRLVVHGVTVETEQALLASYRRLGGELTRISVEHAAPLGGFTGWTPARAVTQWAWTKPYPSEETP